MKRARDDDNEEEQQESSTKRHRPEEKQDEKKQPAPVAVPQGGKKLAGVRLESYRDRFANVYDCPIPEYDSDESLDALKGLPEIPWETMQKTYNEKTGKDLPADAQYGDVIMFFDYRGTGTFYVGGTPGNRLLLPALEEYGYGIPYDFADAPVGYFDKVPFRTVIYACPENVPQQSDLGQIVHQQIKERKLNPKYQGQLDFESGECEVNLEKFPQEYVAVFMNDKDGEPGMSDEEGEGEEGGGDEDGEGGEGDGEGEGEDGEAPKRKKKNQKPPKGTTLADMKMGWLPDCKTVPDMQHAPFLARHNKRKQLMRAEVEAALSPLSRVFGQIPALSSIISGFIC